MTTAGQLSTNCSMDAGLRRNDFIGHPVLSGRFLAGAIPSLIALCGKNPPELKEDHAREEAVMEATGMNAPCYDGQPKVLTPQEMTRLRRL
jgi:hypothetical protein